MCKLIKSAAGIMLAFKLVMIQSEPATTTVTISMPKASASTLLVLSEPGRDVQEEHDMDSHLGDG